MTTLTGSESVLYFFIKSTKSINPSPASLPNEMMVMMMCKKWEGGVTRVEYNGCLCSRNVLGSFLFSKMSVDYNQDFAGMPSLAT